MHSQELSLARRAAFSPNGPKPLFLARPGRGKGIGEFTLFEGLGPNALRELDSLAQTRVVEKGSFVFLPGEKAASAYFLASGRVKVSRLSEDGKEFILELVEPGEPFGESGLFDGGPRETIAEALDSSTLISVPSDRLRNLLTRNPAILMRLTEFLGNRQKQLEKRLVDVAHKKAPQRLADLLVQLGESYGVRDARGTLLRIKLSQSSLGNLLGVSREIVNHAISDLRRRGVIDVADGRVIIQDPVGLAASAA